MKFRHPKMRRTEDLCFLKSNGWPHKLKPSLGYSAIADATPISNSYFVDNTGRERIAHSGTGDYGYNTIGVMDTGYIIFNELTYILGASTTRNPYTPSPEAPLPHSRWADRQILAGSSQLPPRKTFDEPCSGPLGSVIGPCG